MEVTLKMRVNLDAFLSDLPIVCVVLTNRRRRLKVIKSFLTSVLNSVQID